MKILTDFNSTWLVQDELKDDAIVDDDSVLVRISLGRRIGLEDRLLKFHPLL